MIDGHIHYADMLDPVRLDQLIQETGLKGIGLQCIPLKDDLPVEADAFAFAARSPVPVYIFGGIRRNLYALPPEELPRALQEEGKRLMELGCAGIKLLEGKPQIRRAHPIPDFDLPAWEPFWDFAEREQIPLYFHVNDPEEFWDREKISRHALESGWLYDETFVNNEDQYRQVIAVLRRHPGLRVVFPHFFFLSNQLSRLSGLLEQFPGMCIDITPGIELYYNLSRQRREAKEFFEQYQDRILYGTDIGARQVVRSRGERLSLPEAYSRINLIRGFLETDGDYILEADGEYVSEGPTRMYGLGLSEEILEKIYEKNFLEFLGEKPKALKDA